MHSHSDSVRGYHSIGSGVDKSYADFAPCAGTFTLSAVSECKGDSHYQVSDFSVDNEVVAIVERHIVGDDSILFDCVVRHCAEFHSHHIDYSFFSHNLLLLFCGKA